MPHCENNKVPKKDLAQTLDTTDLYNVVFSDLMEPLPRLTSKKWDFPTLSRPLIRLVFMMWLLTTSNFSHVALTSKRSFLGTSMMRDFPVSNFSQVALIYFRVESNDRIFDFKSLCEKDKPGKSRFVETSRSKGDRV